MNVILREPIFKANVTPGLPNVAVTPGTYGDATHIPVLTVDAKGRVTAASEAAAVGGGGGTSVVWKGAWSSGTTYAENDAVSYLGSSWVALQASTAITPTEGAYWTLLAAKGDTGATGATGAQGSQGIQGPQGETGPAGTTTWAGITDKPSTFAPTTHSHAQSDVTDLGTALAGKAATNQKLDDFGTPDDNTDLNVSTTAHGLCPKAPNVTTQFLSGDGTWRTPAIAALAAHLRTLYIDAGAMVPASTNGGDPQSITPTGCDARFDVLDFDSATSESAFFKVVMPEDWDGTTLAVKVDWLNTSTTATNGVVWGFDAGCLSDNDSYGTTVMTNGVTVADASNGQNKRNLSAAMSVIPAGSPTLADALHCCVKRLPSDASDTHGGDARLAGLWIQYRTTGTAPSAW